MAKELVVGGPTGTVNDARRSQCPVACALDIVGDRWTLLVIRDLLGGKRRYGEFLSSAEKIPTNILARRERLRRLEREGLVSRVPYNTRPLRVEYHLTPEGWSRTRGRRPGHLGPQTLPRYRARGLAERE